MKIAVPSEVKDHEARVALTPAGAHELVQQGHDVFIQSGAGVGSSMPDEAYAAQGATIIDGAAATWASGELVLKVKEPIESEYQFLRDDLTLFTYLHLAADEPLTRRLMDAGTTAIAYETVQTDHGGLPLLYPMSEIAGSLAPLVGASALMSAHGGRGVLLGGVAGVAPAKVVILGGGVAGQNAANVALGMAGDVTVLDTNVDKLRGIFWKFGNRVKQLTSSAFTVREQVLDADLVIGTVLIPGAKAPKLVTNELVSQMKPGSVLVDVAVDQGGCFEDTHATTHTDPTFRVHQSVFYCVANMPGAVPNTSTQALTNVTLPYVTQIAGRGVSDTLRANRELARGLNVAGGEVVYAAVAEAFGLDAIGLDDAVARL